MRFGRLLFLSRTQDKLCSKRAAPYVNAPCFLLLVYSFVMSFMSFLPGSQACGRARAREPTLDHHTGPHPRLRRRQRLRGSGPRGTGHRVVRRGRGASNTLCLYLDAEVLVLPPVFLPQDSVFVGCRSASSSNSRPLSRAGFLSFPAPFPCVFI